MAITDQPSDPARPQIDPVGPAAGPRRRRIVVVDDSPEMRGLLEDVLADAGYLVTGAASAPRALELMRRDPPDLVITDLLMPGMSGFSLRSLMLRQPALATVPVVVLSGYWHRPPETLEAAAVLEKPLSIDRLLATVARLLPPHGAAMLEDVSA